MSDLPAPAPTESEADHQKRERRALVEAIIYVTEEPVTVDQLVHGLEWPQQEVETLLAELAADYQRQDRGIEIRAVAGGYKMSTKAEHHEAVRRFVKTLKPPLKLSLAALETLAVIAYKQPVTVPEVLEIRGVSGGGVLKTLLDRKLITTAGRKQVIGRPILYKTTREFLLQFGLNDLSELPSLKEFEELSRAALAEEEPAPTPEVASPAEEPAPAPEAASPASEALAPAPEAASPAAQALAPAPEAVPAAPEPPAEPSPTPEPNARPLHQGHQHPEAPAEPSPTPEPPLPPAED